MTLTLLRDLPPTEQFYVLSVLALASVLIVLNVLFVLPGILREGWIWMCEHLGERRVGPRIVPLPIKPNEEQERRVLLRAIGAMPNPLPNVEKVSPDVAQQIHEAMRRTSVVPLRIVPNTPREITVKAEIR